MKRYGLVIAMLAVLTLAGCEEKKEEVPINTNTSSSLEDEDPQDDLNEELPGEELPDYEVELPQNLSSFTLAVWGEVYELPVSYEDFEKKGWLYAGDDSAAVGPESYLEGGRFERENGVLYADLMNPDTEEKSVRECMIAGLHVDTRKQEEQGVHVNLPGDIVLNQSMEEEVQKAYGSPVDRYEEKDSITFTYEYGSDRSVKLVFDGSTGILVSLDIQNFRTEKKAEGNGGSAQEDAYEAPEYMGTLFSDYIVEYGGALYRIPAPVRAFTENGWEINEDESDFTVEGGQYGYVTLVKGGQKLYASIQNPSAEDCEVQSCLVTTVFGDMDTTRVPVTAAGGVTLGMSEEAFLNCAGEQRYEKSEDENKDCTVYTFYTDEAGMDYTEVTVDRSLKLVRQIKVVNNLDEGAKTADSDSMP